MMIRHNSPLHCSITPTLHFFIASIAGAIVCSTSIAATPTPLPSVELSTFVNANLNTITAPLEQRVTMPRAELEKLRASYKARLPKATPAERKQLKAALAVCKTLDKVMKDRERAMLSPTAVTGWPQRAVEYREVVNQLMQKEKATEVAAPAVR